AQLGEGAVAVVLQHGRAGLVTGRVVGVARHAAGQVLALRQVAGRIVAVRRLAQRRRAVRRKDRFAGDAAGGVVGVVGDIANPIGHGDQVAVAVVLVALRESYLPA